MSLKVRVKDGMMGYLYHKRRREGHEFELEKAADFSALWMIPLGWTPKGKDGKPIEEPVIAEEPKNETGPEEKVQYDLAGRPIRASKKNKEVI